jgi:flagellar biosynthesis activator protein FlaF
MSGYRDITKAYQSAVNLRSQRERDAEVFDIFASRLRDAERAGGMLLAKALADNRNLWQTVTTVTLDDNNPQPAATRRSLLALAAAVAKEMNAPTPDIRALIQINDNVAAGLRGIGPAAG